MYIGISSSREADLLRSDAAHITINNKNTVRPTLSADFLLYTCTLDKRGGLDSNHFFTIATVMTVT
jgi:hypothetical protein